MCCPSLMGPYILLHPSGGSIGSGAITMAWFGGSSWMSLSMLVVCFGEDIPTGATGASTLLVSIYNVKLEQKQFNSKCGDIFFNFCFTFHIVPTKVSKLEWPLLQSEDLILTLGYWTGTFYFCHIRDLTHSTTSDSSLFTLSINVPFEGGLQSESSLDLSCTQITCCLCPITSITVTPVILKKSKSSSWSETCVYILSQIV